MKEILPRGEMIGQKEETTFSKEKKSNGNNWWSFLIEIILYYFFWAIFSFYFKANFIWSNVAAFILTIIAVNLFKLFKTRQFESAVYLLLFIFVAMIATGIVKSNSASNSASISATSCHGSETINVGPGHHYSKVSFPVGQEFRMTVSGAPVVFVHDSTVREKLVEAYGTYTYVSTKEGVLEFSSSKPTTLILEW